MSSHHRGPSHDIPDMLLTRIRGMPRTLAILRLGVWSRNRNTCPGGTQSLLRESTHCDRQGSRKSMFMLYNLVVTMGANPQETTAQGLAVFDQRSLFGMSMDGCRAREQSRLDSKEIMMRIE